MMQWYIFQSVSHETTHIIQKVYMLLVHTSL